jgi:hypothetical protein
MVMRTTTVTGRPRPKTKQETDAWVQSQRREAGERVAASRAQEQARQAALRPAQEQARQAAQRQAQEQARQIAERQAAKATRVRGTIEQARQKVLPPQTRQLIDSVKAKQQTASQRGPVAGGELPRQPAPQPVQQLAAARSAQGQAPTGAVISAQEQARYAAQEQAREQARQVAERQAMPARPYGGAQVPETLEEVNQGTGGSSGTGRSPTMPYEPRGAVEGGRFAGPTQPYTRPGATPLPTMPSRPGVAPLPTIPSGPGMPLGTAPPGGQAGDLAAAVRATGFQGDTFQGRPVPSNTDPMGALRAISGGAPGATPGMAPGTPAFAKGGSVRMGRSAVPSSQSKAASKSKGMPAKAPKPAGYARGGSVRGAGCEVKGLKKATIY